MNTGSVNIEKKRAKFRTGLAFAGLLLYLIACSPFISTTATPTPQPIPDVAEMKFKDPVTGQRFQSLDRAIRDRIDKTWRTTSYQLNGNFYESSWCSGVGSRPGCQIAEATMDNRDQHILNLYTLFYTQANPEFFGLGFQALWVPKTAGWGANFYFAEEGGSIVGEGWQVIFKKYTNSETQPEATINLGWKTSYKLNRTSIEYAPGLSIREDLKLYLANPGAMRDRGLAAMQSLAQKVRTELNAHKVFICDLQPYKGGGIPPECTPRPMTASEEAKELAAAEAYFSSQEQLLKEHYQEMYSAWMSAFPFDQSWP